MPNVANFFRLRPISTATYPEPLLKTELYYNDVLGTDTNIAFKLLWKLKIVDIVDIVFPESFVHWTLKTNGRKTSTVIGLESLLFFPYFMLILSSRKSFFYPQSPKKAMVSPRVMETSKTKFSTLVCVYKTFYWRRLIGENCRISLFNCTFITP